MRVELDGAEMMMAAQVGIRRHVAALVRGLPDRHGLDSSKNDGWRIHIEGAAGELAAAKALDRYWDG